MHIRLATDADIPQLTSLIQAYWAFEEIEGDMATTIERNLRLLLSTPTLGAAWVATDGAELCGYLVAVTVFSLEHGGIMAEVDEFFILPAYRAAGVGKLLLQTAEQTLAAAGCTRIQLEVSRTNDAAHGFYAHLGYQERTKYALLDKELSHHTSSC